MDSLPEDCSRFWSVMGSSSYPDRSPQLTARAIVVSRTAARGPTGIAPEPPSTGLIRGGRG